MVHDRIRFGLKNNFSRDSIENKCKEKPRRQETRRVLADPGKRWTIELISRVKSVALKKEVRVK